MSILDRYFEFVNEQFLFHKQKAADITAKPFARKKHFETANNFEALLDAIKEASKQLDSLPAAKKPRQLRLFLTLEDIKGIPEDLMQELSSASGDTTDFNILTIIQEAGGVTTLDHILVGLYRKTGEVYKRTNVTSRMYRMATKGLVFNTPKKGVYSLEQISDEGFSRLLDRENIKPDEPQLL